MDIVKFIEAIRATDRYIETIYTEGGCYQFFLLLKSIWPQAMPVTNRDADHVGALIDGEVYDITGIVTWYWRPMYDEEVAEAEQWSFGDNKFLQQGECIACGEPILI